ncbi:MAG TPA: hypothetical protein VGC55_12975 [Dokdonella sp.]
MDRTARFPSRPGPACACRDPIPDALAESLWLGGEAMVAPACSYDPYIAERVARDEEPDPSWRAL